MANPEYTPEEFQHEVWRDIPRWEGIYSVSSLGRVRRDLSASGTRKGAILSPRRNRDGYLQLTLRRVGRENQTACVHVLVMLAFVGECPSGQEVNHIDTIRDNPRMLNLEYLTHEENERRKTAQGRRPTGDNHWSRKTPERRATGTRHGVYTHPERFKNYVRLSPEHKSLIARSRLSRMELAQQFQVRRSTISKIRKQYRDSVMLSSSAS